MEILRALQEANEQSRQEQERLREANERSALEQERLWEELRKTHEELRKDLQQRNRRPLREREASLHERDNAEAFSRAIMDEPVPVHYVASKIMFTGVEDPETHLTTFNAQMIISGGSDAIRCKMFMSTFTGTTIQWFSGLPNGHIISFAQFAKPFKEQFYTNRVKPPVLYDLFNVRQREGESLKDYLNRFWAFTVKLRTHDENVMVSAFEQAVASRPFCDSLIKNPTKTFSEIRRRALAHISAEEAVAARNNGRRNLGWLSRKEPARLLGP